MDNRSDLARRQAEARRSLRESWKRAEEAGLDRLTDQEIDSIAKEARRARKLMKDSGPQGHARGASIVLVEVEPNPDGPWDPDAELELGVFSTRAEAIRWLEAMLTEEGWSEEEWRHWPAFGTQGSRFQFHERL